MNALEMALEALTNPSVIAVQHAIELIKAELAKPEQKPWVGLTDEEAQDIAKRLVDDVAYCSTHYAIAIEVALRKKNT